jgi:hypothetical protein
MSQAEDDFWKAKILEARHDQLDTVRKAAASWATLFTAVLGVFGTVTFTTGLTGLDDLADDTKNLARAAIVGAAVLALVATLLFASAANSMPSKTSNLTVTEFQERYKRLAKSALTRLHIAMGAGAAAAVVVILGSVIVLYADKTSAPPKVPSIIAVIDGKTYCGVPAASKDGTLNISDAPAGKATLLTVVAACPQRP